MVRGAERVGERCRRRAVAAGRGEARATAARLASAISGGSANPNSSSTPVRERGDAGHPRRRRQARSRAPPTAARPAVAGRRARRRRRRAHATTPSTRNCMKNSASVCAHRRAEAAEHRGGVEMPSQVARRGERDGDRREQHRHERGEAEEVLRALERLAHFGTQVAHGLDALPWLELGAEPRAIRIERACVVARSRPAGDTSRGCPAAAGWSRVRRRGSRSSLGPSANTIAGDFGFLLHDRARRSASSRRPRCGRRS